LSAETEISRFSNTGNGYTEPFPRPPVTLLRVATILVTTFLVAQILVPLLLSQALFEGPLQKLGAEEQLILTTAILFSQTAILLVLTYILVIRSSGASWFDIGFRRIGRGTIMRAVIWALATVIIVGAVNYALQWIMGESFQNPQTMMLAPGGFSWINLTVMLVMGGVIAPFAEELAFRGLLYGYLRRRMAIPVALLIMAVCFAAAHLIVLLMPALFVVGLILGVAYERSGSLWVPIIVHGVFNSVMMILLYIALATGVPLAASS
jgi:membrane protease YdiL (CAAX protease family)